VLGAGVPSEVIDAPAPDRLLLGLWALQQRYAGDAPWGRFGRTGHTLMAAFGNCGPSAEVVAADRLAVTGAGTRGQKAGGCL
jgi:hypothetical protein